MSFINLLFYLFSFGIIASSLVVVMSSNAVYAVLFLIVAFFNAAGIFILLGAEFLAMLLIVVYVGAIAVLFLFVVMMLNVDTLSLRKKIKPFLPILLFVTILLFGEIILFIKLSTLEDYQINISLPIDHQVSNAKAIGNVLYTKFALPFQLSGAILFVAMIGAILLTLNENKKFIKKQNIFNQVNRNPKTAIKMVKPKIGEGIDI